MESPVKKKKKKFSSADNCLISSATVSENQQQSSGSFGEQKKQINNRTLKKIWICSDVLMDILPFFDRPQLGLKLALLSDRFDVLVDTHFDGKTELTIWRLIKISKDNGPKPELCVQQIDGTFVGFPFPSHPLPNKIRFNQLRIEYIDHSVIEFLHANKHIWNRWGTNLELTLWSNDIDDDEQPIWDVLAREIWPIFAKSIRHLGFSDDEQFDELCQRISPTILTDLDQLVSINCELLMLDDDQIVDDDGISVEQVLSEWLHTPTKNGKAKRLVCAELNGEGNMAWLNSFKETFIRATDTSVSYQICFGIEESLIEPFELMNERTKEKLTLKEGDYIYWLLKRCPISEEAEAAATVQWKNNKNWDHNLNGVQFNLWAAKNCIGPLSPPAADQSGQFPGPSSDQRNE